MKISALAAALLAAAGIFKQRALGSALSLSEEIPETIAEEWIPTSCLNCATRCAIRVRVVNGKAVKITGNPLSNVSEGATCPRANVGLQVLYDPERIKRPLKRTNPVKGKGIEPGWEAISWEEALNELCDRLKVLRGSGNPHQLLMLHGLNTISDEDLFRRFADAYGTPNDISGEGFENEADKMGSWMADGNYTQSAYDLPNTNYILAFGASILESQKPVARNLRMWGKIRRERPNRAKTVVVDPRYSVTASKSDQWIPINPGTDAALAMAIASVIISEDLYDAEFIEKWTYGFNDYKNYTLNNYSPEYAADITGIPAETIRRLAREFAMTKPSIAWRGRGATSWPDGTYTSYAIYCLNALVGSIDIPGGVTYQEYHDFRQMPEIVEDDIARKGKAKPRLDLQGNGTFPLDDVATNQVADGIIDDSPYPVEMALGVNSNFNMSAPGTWRWNSALNKVPYYVHIAPFISEMAEYADMVLPACIYLEQWAYDHSPPGSGFSEVKIKQPVVRPLGESKSVADILFAMAGRLGGTLAQSFDNLGNNGEGFVRYRTANLAPWAEMLEKGVWTGKEYHYYKYDSIFKTFSRKFEFYSGNLEAMFKERGEKADWLDCLPHYKPPAFIGNQADFPLLLSTYQPLLDIENGSQNYPWAQEVFLVMHGHGWGNVAEINTMTARSFGIRDGDMVWVESPFDRIKVKARVFEGIMPGVVSIAGGQGHYAFGKWAKGIGVNPNDITGVAYDHLSGQSAFFNTRVRIYRA